MSLEALLAQANEIDNSEIGENAQKERERLDKLQKDSNFECIGCGS
jgi:hypothetical protein